MSTTMTGIDAKGYLIGWSGALAGMTSADINAVPDDKWTATHGGCTRSAAAIVGDAVALLRWTTTALTTGATPVGDYGMDQTIEDCRTKASAITALTTATEAFQKALSGASDEVLNTNVMTPWQMETPLFMVAQIAVSHVWYHDGQLNFIHSILGDDKIHWMN